MVCNRCLVRVARAEAKLKDVAGMRKEAKRL